MHPSDLMLAVVNLWVQTLLGVPTPTDLQEHTLETEVVYSALYDMKVRDCAKLIMRMRKLSLRLAASGASPQNAAVARGWQWAALLQASEEDPETPATAWAHFIRRMAEDAQGVMGAGTLSAVYLFGAKLHAVVAQMETEARKIGKHVLRAPVKEDAAERMLVEATKALRAQVKARLGAAELQLQPPGSAAGVVTLRQATASAMKTRPLSALTPSSASPGTGRSVDRYSAPTFQLATTPTQTPVVHPEDIQHAAELAQLVCQKSVQVVPLTSGKKRVGFAATATIRCTSPPHPSSPRIDASKAIKTIPHIPYSPSFQGRINATRRIHKLRPTSTSLKRTHRSPVRRSHKVKGRRS